MIFFLAKDSRCWQLTVIPWLHHYHHQKEAINLGKRKSKERVNIITGQEEETKKCVYYSFNPIIIIVSFL